METLEAIRAKATADGAAAVRAALAGRAAELTREREKVGAALVKAVGRLAETYMAMAAELDRLDGIDAAELVEAGLVGVAGGSAFGPSGYAPEPADPPPEPEPEWTGAPRAVVWGDHTDED